jgi:pimeloyl-ACP methyl ester carboxylesterase
MRLLFRALIGALALLLLALGVALLYLTWGRGQTPPILDAQGNPLPKSIAALEELDLNGARQWVLIRGADRARPVLLFLHGGPGMPAMYLAHAWQRPLEEDFVVVHWDRRGAGKSYAAGLAGELGVRQTLADTYALTRHLRERFGQERIFLVGHSWGTYLGMLAAAGHPEYYAAYAGMGQLAGDSAANQRAQAAFLRAEAAGDTALLGRLARTPPEIWEDDLFRYGAELRRARSFWPLLWTGLRAPEYDLGDVFNVKRGAQLVAAKMQYDAIAGPLDQALARLEIPVFFFLGRRDYTTPAPLAEAYFGQLEAPFKQLVWFEESAHFPFFEEPARCRAELVRAWREAADYWAGRIAP